MFVWDEMKRQANLSKHGLDFSDAALVYDNPAKVMVISPREGEQRYADSAIVQIAGACLTLVYTHQAQTSVSYPSDPPRDENGNSLLAP